MAFLCSKLHRKELKISCFSPAINGKAPAHEFSHPGYPGGIEAAFSLKINTFSDRRKEVRLWRYFALRKPATTR